MGETGGSEITRVKRVDEVKMSGQANTTTASWAENTIMTYFFPNFEAKRAKKAQKIKEQIL